MDFTKIFLANKPGEATVVNDCIVVMEYINESTHQRERINFDFLCDDAATNKHDYHYLLTVWVKLFMQERLVLRFDCIDVWSDGGPHHFKTRWCQFMWHVLSILRFHKKRITHHFFASYHGHSLADSHAAIIKRVVLSQYQFSQFQRFSAATFALYWGPSTAHELAQLISQGCSNTRVHVLPDIDRDKERKPQIQGINSIKIMHCFQYQDGVCRCAELSENQLQQQSQQPGSSSSALFSFTPNKAKNNRIFDENS